MPDPRKIVFAWLTFIVLLGIEYSFVHNTYMDTSDPLLAHLPHPLSETKYFANKRNFLNVYFIKYAWGWTSLVFFFLWTTSPPSIRKRRAAIQWIVETMAWMLFTSWFFGPAIFDRFIVASGGECFLQQPEGNPISIPVELCYTKTTISHSTHPHFFPASFTPPSADWREVPRLRKGHDVSGHLFLLTMAIMFLSDQIRPSLARVETWTTLHTMAVMLTATLMCVWVFASYMTCIYFHTPQEKVTGYCKSQLACSPSLQLLTRPLVLGIASFLLSQLI
jgi:hypothetical protein